MKIIEKLDSIFLSDYPEDIATSDRIWFYGFYFIIGIIIFTLAAKLYVLN